MSEKFDGFLKSYFQCERGAFSVVTSDENSKSQLTLVGPEQAIAEELIKDIGDRVGNKKEIADALGDSQVFVRRWPDGDQIGLTIGYKKKKGTKSNELRMYLNKDFKPAPGINWCIFERNGDLWVGQFSSNAFEISGLTKDLLIQPDRSNLEPEIDNYQEAINADKPESVQSVLTKWKRNIRIAAQALKAAEYKCEMFPEIPTFNARGSGRPFMEAHHLVPMSLQGDNENSLDVSANICCLNPYSHRMIHHADFNLIKDHIAAMANKRKEFLGTIGLSVDDVLEIYS